MAAPPGPPERPSSRRLAITVGLVGVLIGIAAVLLVVRGAAPGCCSGSYVTSYDRPVTGVDAVLGRGDGQAFAALAEDPTLARPNVILGYHEFAYRAQRPLVAYLAWAGSLGSADRVPWALAVLEMLGCGLAAGAVAGLLGRRGANPWFGLLAVPAGMAAIQGLTPELLALGFGALGVVAWERRRPGRAATWLTAAALTRETMLIVPAVLAIEVLARAWHAHAGAPGRIRTSARDASSRLLPLGVPFAAFGAWVLVIRIRLDAWPTDGSHGRIGRPFAGLFDAARHWSSPAELVWLGLAVVIVAFAFATARRDRLTWIAGAYAAFAVILGPDVWARWQDFSRTLLPLYAFAAVATLGAIASRARADAPVAPATSSSSASWSSRAAWSAPSSRAPAGRR